MYEHGFPYDNTSLENKDRNAYSDEFAEYLEAITGMAAGVYPNPSTGLQVTVKSGLEIQISPGFCIIKGHIRKLLSTHQDSDFTLDAGASLARIDRIVARHNADGRKVEFAVKKGTPASSPVAPTLTRSVNVYEIGLADIRVNANTTSITQANVTDLRLNSDLCGYMPVFGSFDTKTLYDQIQSDLRGFKNINEADFTQWFENIKGQLSEDVAGNLQNQINEINSVIQDNKLHKDTTITINIADYPNVESVQNIIDSIPKNLNGYRLIIFIKGVASYHAILTIGGFYGASNTDYSTFGSGQVYILYDVNYHGGLKVRDIAVQSRVSFGISNKPALYHASDLAIYNCPSIKVEGTFGNGSTGYNIYAYNSKVYIESVYAGNFMSGAGCILLGGLFSTIYLLEGYEHSYAVCYPENTTITKADYAFYFHCCTVHMIAGAQPGIYQTEYSAKQGTVVIKGNGGVLGA